MSDELLTQIRTEVALAIRASIARVKTPVAAQIMGVSIRTLEAWRAKGKGPKFLRIGRKVRYELVDIETWLVEARQSEARSP